MKRTEVSGMYQNRTEWKRSQQKADEIKKEFTYRKKGRLHNNVRRQLELFRCFRRFSSFLVDALKTFFIRAITSLTPTDSTIFDSNENTYFGEDRKDEDKMYPYETSYVGQGLWSKLRRRSSQQQRMSRLADCLLWSS